MVSKRKSKGKRRGHKQRLEQKDAAAKAGIAAAAERRAQALSPDGEVVVAPTAEGKRRNLEVLHEIAQPLLDELSAEEVDKVHLTLLAAMQVWNSMVRFEGRIDEVMESVRKVFDEEMERPVFVSGVRTMAARKAELFGADHRVFISISVERLPSGELFTYAIAIPEPPDPGGGGGGLKGRL